MFHYTRYTTPKRAMSSRGPSPHHCARATQLLLKCRSSGKQLAALCLIRPVRELNLRPPAPETNTLPLNQQAEKSRSNMEIKQIKQTSNLY